VPDQLREYAKNFDLEGRAWMYGRRHSSVWRCSMASPTRWWIIPWTPKGENQS
jgi:hypothetical protein